MSYDLTPYDDYNTSVISAEYEFNIPDDSEFSHLMKCYTPKFGFISNTAMWLQAPVVRGHSSTFW